MTPNENPTNWSHFPHGADVGVRGSGPTLGAAFAAAALAMTAASVDPDTIRTESAVAIQCSGEDDEDLLYAWLNTVILEMATRAMVFGRFDIEITAGELKATAWGEQIDPERHHPAVEVKGATYTALAVSREDGRWIAQCVVDV
ncbi:MAG: archease [Alphaproteobacteria bacterium]